MILLDLHSALAPVVTISDVLTAKTIVIHVMTDWPGQRHHVWKLQRGPRNV